MSKKNYKRYNYKQYVVAENDYEVVKSQYANEIRLNNRLCSR